MSFLRIKVIFCKCIMNILFLLFLETANLHVRNFHKSLTAHLMLVLHSHTVVIYFTNRYNILQTFHKILN